MALSGLARPQSLRSTCWTRDVRASNPPGLSRVKFSSGANSGAGLVPAISQPTRNRFWRDGHSYTQGIGDWYTNDTLVTGGGWARRSAIMMGFAEHHYFDPPDAYYSTVTEQEHSLTILRCTTASIIQGIAAEIIRALPTNLRRSRISLLKLFTGGSVFAVFRSNHHHSTILHKSANGKGLRQL